MFTALPKRTLEDTEKMLRDISPPRTLASWVRDEDEDGVEEDLRRTPANSGGQKRTENDGQIEDIAMGPSCGRLLHLCLRTAVTLM